MFTFTYLQVDKERRILSLSLAGHLHCIDHGENYRPLVCLRCQTSRRPQVCATIFLIVLNFARFRVQPSAMVCCSFSFHLMLVYLWRDVNTNWLAGHDISTTTSIMSTSSNHKQLIDSNLSPNLMRSFHSNGLVALRATGILFKYINKYLCLFFTATQSSIFSFSMPPWM